MSKIEKFSTDPKSLSREKKMVQRGRVAGRVIGWIIVMCTASSSKREVIVPQKIKYWIKYIIKIGIAFISCKHQSNSR